MLVSHKRKDCKRIFNFYLNMQWSFWEKNWVKKTLKIWREIFISIIFLRLPINLAYLWTLLKTLWSRNMRLKEVKKTCWHSEHSAENSFYSWYNLRNLKAISYHSFTTRWRNFTSKKFLKNSTRFAYLSAKCKVERDLQKTPKAFTQTSKVIFGKTNSANCLGVFPKLMMQSNLFKSGYAKPVYFDNKLIFQIISRLIMSNFQRI